MKHINSKNNSKYIGYCLELYTIENYFKDSVKDLEFCKWRISNAFFNELASYDLSTKKLVNLIEKHLYNENEVGEKPKDDYIKKRLLLNVEKIKVSNFESEVINWFNSILKMLDS